MARSLPLLLCHLLLLVISTPSVSQADAPRVVVSIKPVHALVAGVMRGAGEPQLLIPGGQSPHAFSLRPSDMRKLRQAELIIWLGEAFETPLVHVIESAIEEDQAVALMEQADMLLLPMRRGGFWEARDQGEHSGPAHRTSDLDPHVWLSIDNARTIVNISRDRLMQIDPRRAELYRTNASRVNALLDDLKAELTERLAPVRNLPYLVFHDAYQYFERQFDLRTIGSIVISPDRQPGARRIHEVQNKLNRLKARCIFSEPQFQSRLLETLTRDTQVKTATLDPIGAELEAGPNSYFLLMRNLAESLRDCLEEAS